jgi:hypothetical protein
MVKNLAPEEMYKFIVKDFNDVWDSVAKNKNEKIARGNFLFGMHSMILLEFICRLCSTDQSEKAIKDLSIALNKIQCKYFIEIPKKCVPSLHFNLPTIGDSKNDNLLSILFDLIRNGLAHQYQQIIVDLNDDKHFYIKLTGSNFGSYLKSSRSQSINHLAYRRDEEDDLELTVYPNILFLDLTDAIDNSGVLKRNLQFGYLSRSSRLGQNIERQNKKKKKRSRQIYYDVSIKDLLNVFEGKLVYYNSS